MSVRACIIPIFVPHLGCPHACVFCNQHRITGQQKSAAASDVKKVMETAAAFLPKGEKRQLAFYGGSFTAIPPSLQEELLAAAEPYLKSGEISSIRISTRPDAIDHDVLERLRGYGVETVELGAQSMDDTVLRLCCRGHTAEDVERSARMIKASGFSLILQMMTGLPGDTREKALETAQRLIALCPDGVRVYPAVIVKDTILYEWWKAGKYQEHTVEDAVEICSEILPLFDRAGIPVLRIGLNPTKELSQGEAVAGAYHPALGELVRSRILLKRAEELLSGIVPGGRITLSIGRGKTSQMTGQHRYNLEYLCRRFSLREIVVMERPEDGDEILLVSVEK